MGELIMTDDPFIIIVKTTDPGEIVWAYLLVCRKGTRELEKFCNEVRKKSIDEKGWKYITEWCIKLGLEDLKEKVFNIPPYVSEIF